MKYVMEERVKDVMVPGSYGTGPPKVETGV